MWTPPLLTYRTSELVIGPPRRSVIRRTCRLHRVAWMASCPSSSDVDLHRVSAPPGCIAVLGRFRVERRAIGGHLMARDCRPRLRAGLEESDEASSGRKAPAALRGLLGTMQPMGAGHGRAIHAACGAGKGLALASGRGAGGRRAARAVRAGAGTGRGRPRGP